jgi:hypothetical protein
MRISQVLTATLSVAKQFEAHIISLFVSATSFLLLHVIVSDNGARMTKEGTERSEKDCRYSDA